MKLVKFAIWLYALAGIALMLGAAIGVAVVVASVDYGRWLTAVECAFGACAAGYQGQLMVRSARLYWRKEIKGESIPLLNALEPEEVPPSAAPVAIEPPSPPAS